MNIIFSGRILPYVQTLGYLSFDSSYTLKVGDTVDLRCDFNGIVLSPGVISAVKEPDVRLKSLLESNRELVEYTDEEIDIITKMFDYHTISVWDKDRRPWPTSCHVKFKKYVSKRLLQERFGDSIRLRGGKFRWGDMIATVKPHDESTSLVIVSKSAFIHWGSVLSTRKIDKFKNQIARSRRVEGVAYSDDALDKSEIDRLNIEIDRFCKDNDPDYHPGSGMVVRDIIHPSLYCYVKNQTIIGPVDANEGADSPFRGPKVSVDFWGRRYDDSVYQWLPSEFDVSADGAVSIRSYINNLDEVVYPKIGDGLANLFRMVLPLFELVCGSLRNDYEGAGADSGVQRIPLRGRRLQVITKVVEYKVDSEANFDGVWHVEGMSHEEIIATALCIVRREENFKGAEIQFRRFLYKEEADNLVYASPNRGHKATDMMDGGDVRPLGSLETPEDRVIVFPNSHIHRLTNMYSADGRPAVRRIVVFWLVNPERRIVSTRDVPRQQGIITREQALRNRLALMAERKLFKQTFEEREVELCEH